MSLGNFVSRTFKSLGYFAVLRLTCIAQSCKKGAEYNLRTEGRGAEPGKININQKAPPLSKWGGQRFRHLQQLAQLVIDRNIKSSVPEILF